MKTDMGDNYKIKLIGEEKESFLGYISSLDPTLASPRAMIAGSQNTYKKRSGTVSVRPGIKRRGAGNTDNVGIVASFEWDTSFGGVIPLRVIGESEAGGDGKLQFESDIVDGETPLWYDLLTDLSLTRFVFDTWWDQVQSKDTLVMANGDNGIKNWSGGVAVLESTTNVTGSVIVINSVPAAGGSGGYIVGDILTLVGGDGTVQVEVVSAGGGVIIAVNSDPITSVGSGYTATTYATTGGSGTGATITVAQIADTAKLTKVGSETWQEVGFETENHKSITINGNDYTYIFGFDTRTLTGVVTSAAASEPVGSIVTQTVAALTDLPVEGFTSDFLKTVSNQVYVGSYSSRIVYSSSQGDFEDFSNSGSHVVGDPDMMIFDEQCKGIGEQSGKICIFAGSDLLYLVTPNVNVTYTYTGQDGNAVFAYNAVEKVALSGLSAVLAHEFIDNFGDYIVWMDQSNQVRALGTFTDNLAKQPVYLSLPVWDELEAEDFTGGALRVVDDTIYLTAPVTTRTWLYQNRQIINELGQIVAEKLWQPPQLWDISRIAIIDGLTYGHSASNPDIYQLWDTDQWHDDTPEDEEFAGYKCVARFGYSRNKRFDLISFDKVAFEGYILENAPLNLDIIYDYQGSTKITNAVLQDADNPMELFQAPDVGKIGGQEIGDSDIGGASGSEFPKFKVLGTTSPQNCFEYTLELWSDSPDARWELLTYGTNITLSTQEPTLINRSIS